MSPSGRSVLLTDLCIRTLKKNAISKMENIVLWHLVDELPISGGIIELADLKKQLSATRLSRIMKRLMELGFLIKGVKMGRSYHYKLNPTYFGIIK